MKNNIYAMYFSPTGTTKKIVETICGELGHKLGQSIHTINFTLPEKRQIEYSFSQDDIVIFGISVIAGRVPNVLLKFLDTIKGNGAFAVPVVLFGNRNYDDALIELRDILQNDGFHTIAAGAFVGEHSFSNILAKNRPDEKDLEIAVEFANKISEKLNLNTGLNKPIDVKGESPLRPYYKPRDRQGNFINILKVKPKTSDACNECGICAKVCPMGSIDPENVREFINICIKCGACIKVCPVGAKYYDDDGYLYHKTELEQEYTRRAEPEIFV